MKWYARPFVFIHRLLGAAISAVLGSTLFLGVGGLILGILGVLLAALGYALVWGILLFICIMIGWTMISFIRLFHPEYQKDKVPMMTQVAEKAENVSGDLRRMAKDHL